MEPKEPVLLTVLIETANLRWYVAGINLKGEPIPLMCSETGNLGAHIGDELDEQVSFLRHRLSGVLQRGCDRLWGRLLKPCQIVFVADGPFIQAPPELALHVAEHFVEWMTRPPVVFFNCENGLEGEDPRLLKNVAGDMEPQFRESLDQGLPGLIDAMKKDDLWELAAWKPRTP
jgi:hypothetical protein